MATDVTPPGKAQIVPCPECQGVARRACYECEGRGSLLTRACPLCGDLAWDYVNGTDDRDGMTCSLGCGYQWSADHPAWRAKILPAAPA